MKSLSRVWLFATPWTAAPPMGFSRQEYWSRFSFPSPGIFPTQGLNPSLLHCRQTLYHLSHLGSPWLINLFCSSDISAKRPLCKPSVCPIPIGTSKRYSLSVSSQRRAPISPCCPITPAWSLLTFHIQSTVSMASASIPSPLSKMTATSTLHISQPQYWNPLIFNFPHNCQNGLYKLKDEYVNFQLVSSFHNLQYERPFFSIPS